MQQFLHLDASLTALLRLADRPGLKRSTAMFLAHSGDSWFWLAGLLVVWLLGSDYWHERARVLAAGIVLTAVLVLAIKFLVRRKRPEGEWGAIYRSTDPHSFPSGHAARAALIAVLAVLLGPPWFAALLLVWAPLVSLARVAMGVHFLSDVVAGMALGVVMALVVGRLMIY
jgi:membrane-associated phospholipid phosphatase